MSGLQPQPTVSEEDGGPRVFLLPGAQKDSAGGIPIEPEAPPGLGLRRLLSFAMLCYAASSLAWLRAPLSA